MYVRPGPSAGPAAMDAGRNGQPCRGQAGRAEVLTALCACWSSFLGEPVPAGLGAERLRQALLQYCPCQLMGPFPDKLFRNGVEEALRVLSAFFFQPGARHRRHWAEAELLLSTLLMVRGLLVMRAGRRKRPTQRVAAMGGPTLMHALLAESPRISDIRGLVQWQSAALAGSGGVDEAVVYSHFSRGTVYVGKALTQRSRGVPGPTARLFEHLVATERGVYGERAPLRYRRLRRVPVHERAFIILLKGPHDEIKAAEQVIIKCRTPNGNLVEPVAVGVPRRRARTRPFPWARCRRADGVQNLWTQGAAIRMQRHGCRALAAWQDTVAVQRAAAWRMQSFTTAYRALQRKFWEKTGKAGPIDLYTGQSWNVSVLWACTRGGGVFWRKLGGRWGDVDGVLRLARDVAAMPGFVRRRRAQFHIDRRLAALELPARRILYVRSSGRAIGEVRRALAGSCARMARARGTSAARWMRAWTRVVVVPPPRMQELRNAIAESRAASLDDLLRYPFTRDACLRGEGLQKLPGNWSVPRRRSDRRAGEETAGELQAWARRARRPPKEVHRLVRNLRFEGLGDAGRHQPPEERNYIAGMRHREFEVLAQDDKDRRRTWGMTRMCLWSWLVCQVFRDPDRWVRVDISHADLKIMVIALCMFALPKWLQAGGWAYNRIVPPYMYLFVKSKCFHGSGIRKCCKQGHSCMRKVVSFAGFPKRRAWRIGSRALQTMAMVVGGTLELWKLGDAVPRLRAVMASLRSPTQPCTCVACGAPKPYLVLLAADAAQMYEECESGHVMGAFGRLAQDFVEATGKDTVTVSRRGRLHGWPGGRPGFLPHGRAAIGLSDLQRMLWASTTFSFATVGPLVFRLRGMLIGGLLARMATAIVLGAQERHGLSSEALRKLGLLPPGWSQSELFGGARYVDDLLLASKALCHGCLARWVKGIFQQPFEVEAACSTLEWLDLVVEARASGELAWTPKNPNKPWLEGHAERAQERYPPYLGRLQAGFGALRGRLLGRAARLRELQLGVRGRAEALADDVRELLMVGHPWKLIRKLVHSLGTRHQEYIILQAAVRATMKELAS